MKSSKKQTDNAVNPKVLAALLIFIDATPPLRLNKHLRRILLDYIAREKDCLPIDFDIYLLDLSNLFEFLDAIADPNK
jgi:hypothetical protein